MWDTPAVEYVNDWVGQDWAFAIVVVAIAAAAIFLTPTAMRFASDTDSWVGKIFAIVVIIVALVGLFVLYGMPGTMMRHIPDHASVGWVVVGFVVLAVLLAIGGALFSSRVPGPALIPFLPALVVAGGVIFGGLADALSRFSSWFPVSELGGLAMIGAAIFVLANARSGRR